MQSQFESLRFHGNKFSDTRGLVNDPVSDLAPRIRTETLIGQSLHAWEGHSANLWRKIDMKIFGLFGFAKADSWTPPPTAQVPANIENIKPLREA